jgi:membrane protein
MGGISDFRKPVIPPEQAGNEANRGREADEPHQLPKQGWLDVLSRTGTRISTDNISIVAAGVAFYAFVAVVPTLAAVIGIYGLVSDPSHVGSQVTAFARILPKEVLPVLEQQLTRITSNSQAAGISAIVGVLVALYGAASATKALIQGLNICYGEREKRGFIRLNAVALLLTFVVIIGAILALAMVAVIPALLENLSFGSAVDTILNWARWPILIAGFIFGLAVMYRYAPSRRDAKWSWVSWGATVAALLWVAGSALFSLYVAKFGSYDKTYGSLAAIVVFLMWLYLSAFAILLGAELNSEMERQTLKDTTEGPPKPMGERGAESADTVGPSRHTRGGEEKDKDKARPPSRQRRGP